MKKLTFLLLALLFAGLITSNVSAQTKPAGGVLSGISDESNYSKFATLLKTANMESTLQALGSYTIFAPHNVIFRGMTPAKMDSLTSDPAKLTTVLKAHIVKGKFTKTQIIKMLGLGKGKTKFTNLLGQPLKLARDPQNQLILTDANGITAGVISFDLMDPTGVIHGIDNVLMIGK